jgi:4-hydroxybenzoate polyprenyltransferase
MTLNLGSFTDITTDGWLERKAPPHWHPYMRLMRLDRPIGAWLLLLPGLWSIALSATFWRGLWLSLLFALGAVVMRGAGCVVNDILDRDYDRAVERTAARPLASGEVSLVQALLFLAALLAVGLVILLTFNHFAFWLGAASLLLVFPYPLMKRFTDWPQLWLGLTFNWGALLGYAAVTGHLSVKPFLLYLGGICWTLGYDTIYALQDVEDDAVVGIRSTALHFGPNTPLWLMRFYSAAFALFALAGLVAGLRLVFILGILAAGAHLAWQIRTLKMDDPADCLAKFRSNQIFGLILWAAIILDRAL